MSCSAISDSSNPLTSKKTPWGSWSVLLETSYCKVKRITVNENKRLSYQKHLKRQENWTIVQGTAHIILDDTHIKLNPGESIFIPKEAKHRVGNKDKEPLIFIEIQYGDYFGEDDIIRFEDDFGRV